MSTTTASRRTTAGLPRRPLHIAPRPSEPVAPADFVAAGTIRRIAGIGATVFDALQVLERRGKSATNALQRDLTGVLKLVGDELRHIRENAPPLLNPVPFPL